MFKKNDVDGVIENRALENRECRENKLREQGKKNEKENVPLKNAGNNNNNNNGNYKKKEHKKGFFQALFTEKGSKKLQLIPLGGLGEIGKNMLVVRYGKEILIVDAGLSFPEEEMLGIDVVIPDLTYLIENKEFIRAVVLTHSHEDHIGALPYLLKEIPDIPIYGSALSLGLIAKKFDEHRLPKKNFKEIKPGDQVNISCFAVQFIQVTHSIPVAMSLAITTPVGKIVHTGDFKFDQTPVDGKVADYYSLAKLGHEGVLALLADSTNAEREGVTMSESSVGRTFDEIFRNADERIILATFSSNVHRIQQAIYTAHRYNRKVSVLGRSMQNIVEIATELGYLILPDKNMLIDIDEVSQYPKSRILILMTGTQGEPMSALTRVAKNEHRKIEIVPTDTVIISATPIPGNEKLVSRTVNALVKKGAEVVYEHSAGMHVSGHAGQDELKLMFNLVRPRYFIPVHGEARHLAKNAKLAQEVGIPKENIFMMENGSVLELTHDSAKLNGKVHVGACLIDGLGVGDVGSVVLRDRQQLAEDGIFIITFVYNQKEGMLINGPEIVSRGFIYMREAEALIDEAKKRVVLAIEKSVEQGTKDWNSLKNKIREDVGRFLYERTRRKPMIIPIIIDS